MKTIYLVQSDSFEAQGFIDENLNIINCWALNDAEWRSEYFNYGFRELGIEIKIGTPEMNEHFVNFLREEWA